MNSKSMGRSDKKIIPDITISKFALTISKLPKKYPSKVKPNTQANPPMMLKRKKVKYFMFPIPATKGAKVLTIGTNRAITIALDPCLLKKSCV